MLEIALLFVASVIALACAFVAARRAQHTAGPAETRRSARHLRDDAVVAAAASVVMFALTAIGHGRAGAMIAAAWAGGACAMGALAAMTARAWKERAVSQAAGAVAEQVAIVFALGALTALAAAAAHAISDPQRLAAQVPEMIASFAVGCAALDMGERALPSVAAMVLASYFFDSNAGVLRSGPSYASALGVVLFPLALVALAAVGAAVASVVWPDEGGSGVARRAQAASVLALPAALGAALALAGWLWAPLAICAALGAAMTLVPRLVDRSTGDPTPGRAAEAAALVSLAAVAIGSYAVREARRARARRPASGSAIAAVAAESRRARRARRVGRFARRSSSRGARRDRRHARRARRRDALSLHALRGPRTRADGGHRVASRALHAREHRARARRHESSRDDRRGARRSRCVRRLARGRRTDAAHARHHELVRRVGVAGIAAVAHFGFGLGIEAAAAATLAASLAAALFPGSASRNVAALIAASALALGAVIA